MKARSLSIVGTLILTSGGFAQADPVLLAPPLEPTDSTLVLEETNGWIASSDDNLCGIDDLKKVTNPGKVDYKELLDSTPQIKEMKRKNIDPGSTEGQALRKGAKTLITKSCQAVRKARGFCGVWKVIRNKDGRVIPDVTEDVAARF